MARKSNQSFILNRVFQIPVVNDLGLMFLRIVASLMLLTGHGFVKFSQMLQLNFDFADPLGVGPMVSLIGAALSEFVFPLFVIIGLFTRLACIPVFFTMAVAGVVVHASDPLFPEFVTQGGQYMLKPFKEYALLYAIIFGLLMFTGPGRISLDRVFGLDKGLFSNN